MSTAYSIAIINNSGRGAQFSLFQAPASPSNLRNSESFLHVYRQSGLIAPGNCARFSMTNVLAPRKKVTLGPGGTIATLSSVNHHYGYSDSEDAGFTSSTQTVDDRGGFKIVTEGTIRYPSRRNMFIGVGGRSLSGEVVPIQTYDAKPDTNNKIYPLPIFYIPRHDEEQGTFVLHSSLNEILKVDFQDADALSAIFTLDDNDAYVADRSTD
ncbi:hypothetical protein EDB81DRAFT_914234 [Dactylonectria macrodidyma]|uniref:Uncharacterized protein n=1 Tax=Dactylonectria macrodidyma TaxID=307937 RepID=A0A9P9DKH2_9HYPO|nr:hypothetical protein EDB81DRAFT_914234 [Dactylonectria macrodidyma]